MKHRHGSGLAAAIAIICLYAGTTAEARNQAQGTPEAIEQSPMRPAASEARATCPEDWFDTATVQVLCTAGFQRIERTFLTTQCVHCQLTDDASEPLCEGAWRPAEGEFVCAPGYEMVYTQDGSCKRCKAARASCKQDADCVRTGCSGQLCASEAVSTTCEWREAYACYHESFAHCGCIHGSCAWAPTPDLLECVSAAHASAPNPSDIRPSLTDPQLSP